MLYPSPLRYPGGKRSISRFVKLIVATNDLKDGEYVEVYAGGASVGLALLLGEFVSCIHLNDLNKQIFTFWQAVLNETDELCRLIENTEVTVEEWNQQKQVYNNLESYSTLEVAFATFFLNRTNVSGIFNGGIIGGHNQTGNYTIKARYNTPDLINRIRRIAKYRERIRLYNMDAAELIPTVIRPMQSKTLVYLDPPYYVKGAKLYDNHYNHDNHVEIRRLIARHLRSKKWIVSYDNVEEIRAMYEPQYQSLAYSLRYSARSKTEGQEVMYFSHNLQIPDIDSPAYMSVKQYRKLTAEYTQLRLPL